MSCLFNSFSHFKHIVKNDSSEVIRSKICDYLESNPQVLEDIKAEQIVDWESNMKLEDYVRRMRSTSTWGGANEIFCFCKIYNVNVEVINIRDGKIDNNVIQFKNTESNETIKITWSGGHYEPVR
jgi:hypothetical protein